VAGADPSFGSECTPPDLGAGNVITDRSLDVEALDASTGHVGDQLEVLVGWSTASTPA
jgi:hypothetical protein